jgi:hypothetical protein
MIKRLTALAAVGVAGLITAAVGLGGGTAATTLRGAVGPGFTISLSKGGQHVTKLRPGTYRFVISDRSTEHNFVLRRGSSVRQLTSIPFVGTKTVTLKLAKGTWTFFCAPHASAMFGRFGVGTAVARSSSRQAEPGDDRGAGREAEPGDDRGAGNEAEPGDDRGAGQEAEPGDDRGGHEAEPGDDHGHGGHDG